MTMPSGAQPAQARAAEDVCASKNWFGATPDKTPCKVCDACQGQDSQCTLYPAYKPNCCGRQQPSKTPHHMVPVHCFMPPGERAAANRENRAPNVYKGCEKYDEDLAPCICVTKGGKDAGDHQEVHNKFDPREDAHKTNGQAGTWTYAQARDAAAKSASEVFGCDEKCMKAQLDEYHKQQCDIKDKQPLRADSGGKGGSPAIALADPAFDGDV